MAKNDAIDASAPPEGGKKTAGKPAVKVLGDGWTAVTKDKGLSAHFEHTVVVTETGCRVLTLPEPDGPAATAAG